jgi:hypothetical protein
VKIAPQNPAKASQFWAGLKDVSPDLDPQKSRDPPPTHHDPGQAPLLSNQKPRDVAELMEMQVQPHRLSCREAGGGAGEGSLLKVLAWVG